MHGRRIITEGGPRDANKTRVKLAQVLLLTFYISHVLPIIKIVIVFIAFLTFNDNSDLC